MLLMGSAARIHPSELSLESDWVNKDPIIILDQPSHISLSMDAHDIVSMHRSGLDLIILAKAGEVVKIGAFFCETKKQGCLLFQGAGFVEGVYCAKLLSHAEGELDFILTAAEESLDMLGFECQVKTEIAPVISRANGSCVFGSADPGCEVEIVNVHDEILGEGVADQEGHFRVELDQALRKDTMIYAVAWH